MKTLKSKRRKSYQRGYDYVDDILVLDYKTRNVMFNNVEHSVINEWKLCNNKVVASGKTLQEMKSIFDKINEYIGRNKVVIFIPNLTLFFQYLKGIHDFKENEAFIITEDKKVLYCYVDHIEFRCMKFHSNMNMNEYTNKYGDSVYDDGNSILDNCLAIRSAIINEMRIENHDLYSFPQTATGYVRNDIKKAMQNLKNIMRDNLTIDVDTYRMLDKALRGGNCIANRFKIGEIVENVKSADRCSAYTDSILNHKFPIKQFFHQGACSLERYDRIVSRNHAVIMKIELRDVELKDMFNSAPYLDVEHCQCKNVNSEYGRIIDCKYLETVVTDIDFKIICNQYNFGFAKILDLSYSKYGKLPENILNVQREYYKMKTELKNVKGQELYYNKNKAKNNAIAGIFQERPIKESYSMVNGKYVKNEKSFEQALEDANNTSYVSFAWGVWCTAWARWELQQAIDLAGYDFLYSDTDSIKYTGEIDWDIINDTKEEEGKINGGVADDINGIPHYVGVWEKEDTADKFCTLGQKKYACTYGDKLVITVSGLDKEKGSKELVLGDNYGSGIERFKDANNLSYTFYTASGNRAVYNEVTEPIVLDDGTIITSNVLIKPGVFTLGGEENDYDTFIKIGELNWVTV